MTVSGTVVAVSSLTESVYNPLAVGVKRYQTLRETAGQHAGAEGSPVVVASETSTMEEEYGKGPPAGTTSALEQKSFGGGAAAPDHRQARRNKALSKRGPARAVG